MKPIRLTYPVQPARDGRFIPAQHAKQPALLSKFIQRQLRFPGKQPIPALISFNHRDYGNAPAQFGIALLLPAQALRNLR
jgi:hypothetical protein